MPKYLFQGSYTPDGIKGVLKEGGNGRKVATEKLIESLGGQLESFYFAFGADDFAIIADLPDQRTAAAISLAVGADGHIHSRTTVLMTPDEIDAAATMTVPFRPPTG